MVVRTGHRHREWSSTPASRCGFTVGCSGLAACRVAGWLWVRCRYGPVISRVRRTMSRQVVTVRAMPCRWAVADDVQGTDAVDIENRQRGEVEHDSGAAQVGRDALQYRRELADRCDVRFAAHGQTDRRVTGDGCGQRESWWVHSVVAGAHSVFLVLRGCLSDRKGLGESGECPPPAVVRLCAGVEPVRPTASGAARVGLWVSAWGSRRVLRCGRCGRWGRRWGGPYRPFRRPGRCCWPGWVR